MNDLNNPQQDYGPDYKVTLIMLCDPNGKFLLQHRTDDAYLLPGYWAFFGGGVHDGESLEDSLRREVYEELNYTPGSPTLMHEQYFKEGDVEGYLYIYIDRFTGDKSSLKLREGQGWGWFSEPETHTLKMTDRDREIVKRADDYIRQHGTRAQL
ncbi:NUDIX domain-containing protein [Elusimicrobiota bacterium]